MRLATWNVNSIRTRSPRVVDFLERHEIDVLLMQETKCREDQFPYEDFLGGLFGSAYEIGVCGLNQWNGVAIASRIGISDITPHFPGQPEFAGNLEPRAIFATVAGLRVGSVYVPNGRAIGHAHYHYKLEWLGALRTYLHNYLASPSSLPLVVGGDWNVIPRDEDTYDVSAHDGLYLSPEERRAWEALAEAGLEETTISRTEGYTFWDYQGGAFRQNKGMRIDHIWASPVAAQAVTTAFIDVEERSTKGASDHAPVVIDLEL